MTYSVKLRRQIYNILGKLNKLYPARSQQIIILCYHSISSDWRFGVSLSEFKSQINYLRKYYQFISLTDLVNYIKGKKEIKQPSVVISFDDGYQDILLTKKFLTELGIRPVVFIISDPDHLDRNIIGNHKPLLNNKQIKELNAAGWEIGCHSASHTNFSKIKFSEITEEILKSKKDLENKLNFKIKYFSYPKGVYSEKILEVVKSSGFLAAVTMDDGFIDRYTDLFKIPRIGIDGTHGFLEFQSLFTRPAIIFRKIIKSLPLSKYYIC